MQFASAQCASDEDSVTALVASAPSGTRYRFVINCVSEQGAAVCANPITCAAPPGSVRYDVQRSTDGGATWEKVSEACLTNPPPGTPPVITAAMVANEFQRLDWPASGLQVQPPGGRTLVNLATNFFTTDTAASTQTVQLLGQGVEIEATPTSWTLVHGDGTSQTTSRPGRPYPALDVTHTYTRRGRVEVRMDTTYTGRWRLNGGAWQTIADTLTVTGAATGLEILTAHPQLVGSG